MYSFEIIVQTLARAGGGGSGGDGDGASTLLALVGYVPSYYLGKLVKKLLPRRAELIVSASFAVFFSIILLIVGMFGGLLGFYITLVIVVGIWAGWAAAFFGLWDKLSEKNKAAKNTITAAAATDAIWNETQMLDYARQTFLRYQADWSQFAQQSIDSYTTPAFARRTRLLLATLGELGRRNEMSNVVIEKAMIIEAQDNSDDSQDSYLVAFQAKADDKLLDKAGNVLFQDNRPFVEYWRFMRDGTTWRLGEIIQNSQDLSAENQSLRSFAESNSMVYSLDIGWLLLPTNGILIKRGELGVSDINNHVVGTYQGHLVQFYTFSPTPNMSGGENPSWLVMQATLPKSYGGIIIQRRRKLLSNTTDYTRPSKEYTKYQFEWPDFNDRYEVQSTDADRLATFELLNPGFMAYLYDNDPGIGIEVVDNVLYLFKPIGNSVITNVDTAAYHQMLTISLKAFKELQL